MRRISKRAASPSGPGALLQGQGPAPRLRVRMDAQRTFTELERPPPNPPGLAQLRAALGYMCRRPDGQLHCRLARPLERRNAQREPCAHARGVYRRWRGYLRGYLRDAVRRGEMARGAPSATRRTSLPRASTAFGCAARSSHSASPPGRGSSSTSCCRRGRLPGLVIRRFGRGRRSGTGRRALLELLDERRDPVPDLAHHDVSHSSTSSNVKSACRSAAAEMSSLTTREASTCRHTCTVSIAREARDFEFLARVSNDSKASRSSRLRVIEQSSGLSGLSRRCP